MAIVILQNLVFIHSSIGYQHSHTVDSFVLRDTGIDLVVSKGNNLSRHFCIKDGYDLNNLIFTKEKMHVAIQKLQNLQNKPSKSFQIPTAQRNNIKNFQIY